MGTRHHVEQQHVWQLIPVPCVAKWLQTDINDVRQIVGVTDADLNEFRIIYGVADIDLALLFP